MMKKVLVVLNNDVNIDVRVLNELRILHRAGSEIGVICTGKDRQLNSELREIALWRIDAQSLGYKFKFISSTTNGLFHRFWKEKILAVAKEFNPEIIHAHDLYMGIAVREAASHLGLPFIIDLHENYPIAFTNYSWTNKWPHKLFVNKNFWRKEESSILSAAAGIITLSLAFRDNLRTRHHDIKGIPMIEYPNVPDLTEFDDFTTIQPDSAKFNIFYFGLVSKPRCLHIVSAAIKQLRNQGINVEFTIAGSVAKADLDYFNATVMTDGVKHIPWVDLPKLGEVISPMHVCISPIEKNDQHESGVANKVFQYMYFGKPLIVSNCLPQQNLVLDTVCGLSYKYEDVDELANAIVWMKNNPDQMQIFGQNARESILQKYNTREMGKNIIELYAKIN